MTVTTVAAPIVNTRHVTVVPHGGTRNLLCKGCLLEHGRNRSFHPSKLAGHLAAHAAAGHHVE